MKCFLYNDELYIRAVPGKKLFHSTMVHEVVNRGDIFAIRCKDQMLTIIPGEAEVQHLDMNLQAALPPVPAASKKPGRPQIAELLQLKLDLLRAVDEKFSPSSIAERANHG